MKPTKKMLVIRVYKCGDYCKTERIRTIEIPADTHHSNYKRIAMLHGGNALSAPY